VNGNYDFSILNGKGEHLFRNSKDATKPGLHTSELEKPSLKTALSGDVKKHQQTG